MPRGVPYSLVHEAPLRRKPPSFHLPKIGSRNHHSESRVSSPNITLKNGTRFSSWSALPHGHVGTHSHQTKPWALYEIEDFLHGELNRPEVAEDPGLRFQTHREAFDMFIAHFGAYSASLSSIKREYETKIDSIGARDASRTRSEHAELLATHERVSASLCAQLDDCNKQLRAAEQQVVLLHQKLSERPAVGCSGVESDSIVGALHHGSCATSKGGEGRTDVDAGFVQNHAEGTNMLDHRATFESKVNQIVVSLDRVCNTPKQLQQIVLQLLSMLTSPQLVEVHMSQSTLPHTVSCSNTPFRVVIEASL